MHVAWWSGPPRSILSVWESIICLRKKLNATLALKVLKVWKPSDHVEHTFISLWTIYPIGKLERTISICQGWFRLHPCWHASMPSIHARIHLVQGWYHCPGQQRLVHIHPSPWAVFDTVPAWKRFEWTSWTVLALPLQPALESQILTEPFFPGFLLIVIHSSLCFPRKKAAGVCLSHRDLREGLCRSSLCWLEGTKGYDPEFKGCSAQESSQGQNSSWLYSVTSPQREEDLNPFS